MSGTRASVRISLASLRTHKRRFAGTFSAVLIGVAFLAGTLVMGDTLRASFDTMFGNASSGTDSVVRSSEAITTGDNPQGAREPVDTRLVDTIEKVPGVAAAAPSIEGPGQIVGSDGEPVGGGGPPTMAGNWVTDRELNPYDLAEGHAPRASGEIVINRGAAESGGLEVGDRTTLRTPEPVEVEIVGLATFGGEDGMAETTFAGMTRADAEKYLATEPGRAATIDVRAEPGTGQEELTKALADQLPRGVEAITGEAAADEQQENTSGEFLGLFTTLLLVFSGIALFVATFSIHNTFAIVVAQRSRENALMRALGASRRQVLGSTMVEAAVVGTLASAVGLGGGIAIAAGLQALFPAIGFPFPEGDLVISAMSMLLPLVIGVLVTLGSAVLPAVRAGRTAPLAALRETAVESAGASRTRAVAGAVLGAAGVVLAVAGAGGTVLLTSLGAVLVVVAFVVLGPVVSSLAVRVLGRPVARARGISGALAQRNALRSPKRTAATATALMIGVAVVSLFTVFASSLKATMDDTVSRNFAGDAAVTASSGFGGQGPGGAGLSPRLEPAVEKLPEVETALGLGRGVARIDGGGTELTVTDPARLGGVLDVGEVTGSFDDFGTHGIAVSEEKADDRGWRVGSRAELVFADGEKQTFTVRALYDQPELTGDYVITREAWAPHRTQDADWLMVVTYADGVPSDRAQAAVERAAEPYGSPEVQSRDEYVETSASGIDMMLSLVYALLALAVLIALLGIANTLTLAVHERTRELGLLRSVGQTRAQLRAMVRWESVLVAAFGTAGGLVLGGFLSWALVTAADAQAATPFTFDVPPVQLTLVALVGVAVGLLAGWRPARRAARLDVLRAIATE
ncbi:ABC transporter substrate-binding protein [Streptomyces armeniacus]|uniref:ABC transporter substrate-binding protein n=1 Tax=Streptomyces armeniacus TaxID=83291 RepID=A0A345XK58_9ACTN|nr:FtsX-like permease family protein [Streptomyces armeniacus]AXK32024.1 ABC transporter substrate-binding protein [Streptomyces armeniacus]